LTNTKRKKRKTLVNLGIKGPIVSVGRHLQFSFEDRIMRSYVFIFCLAMAIKSNAAMNWSEASFNVNTKQVKNKL
jgi:hypothetical protein